MYGVKHIVWRWIIEIEYLYLPQMGNWETAEPIRTLVWKPSIGVGGALAGPSGAYESKERPRSPCGTASDAVSCSSRVSDMRCRASEGSILTPNEDELFREYLLPKAKTAKSDDALYEIDRSRDIVQRRR